MTTIPSLHSGEDDFFFFYPLPFKSPLPSDCGWSSGGPQWMQLLPDPRALLGRLTLQGGEVPPGGSPILAFHFIRLSTHTPTHIYIKGAAAAAAADPSSTSKPDDRANVQGADWLAGCPLSLDECREVAAIGGRGVKRGERHPTFTSHSRSAYLFATGSRKYISNPLVII